MKKALKRTVFRLSSAPNLGRGLEGYKDRVDRTGEISSQVLLSKIQRPPYQAYYDSSRKSEGAQ